MWQKEGVRIPRQPLLDQRPENDLKADRQLERRRRFPAKTRAWSRTSRETMRRTVALFANISPPLSRAPPYFFY